MAQGFNFNIKQQDQSLEFTINTKIYSLAAIYQAAYLFLDKVYVFLDGEPEKEVKVVMRLKSASVDGSTPKGPLRGKLTMTTSADLEKLAGEFYNELLNQLLREKVSESNAKIREYIVSAALYNAVPNEVDRLLQEVEEEDWQEDPLGITKTWEDNEKSKEGKESKKGKKGETG